MSETTQRIPNVPISAAPQAVSRVSVGGIGRTQGKHRGAKPAALKSSDADLDAEDLPSRKDKDRGSGSAPEFQPAVAAPHARSQEGK